MQLRLCKIVITALSFFFLLLVVFNNATDPNSNYQFVRHVLSMDTTFPGNAGMYRAIRAPIAHKVFYASIIAWEGLCCALVGAGSLKLWKARRASTADWKASKGLASVGLTAGMVLWYFGFTTVGGEWFLMWQSRIWNGKETAFSLFVIMGLSLLLLNQADD
jgi:predicted small integral membrane protein